MNAYISKLNISVTENQFERNTAESGSWQNFLLDPQTLYKSTCIYMYLCKLKLLYVKVNVTHSIVIFGYISFRCLKPSPEGIHLLLGEQR